MTILSRERLNRRDLAEPAVKRIGKTRLKEVRYAVRHKRPEVFHPAPVTIFVTDQVSCRFHLNTSERKATHLLMDRSLLTGRVGMLFISRLPFR